MEYVKNKNKLYKVKIFSIVIISMFFVLFNSQVFGNGTADDVKDDEIVITQNNGNVDIKINNYSKIDETPKVEVELVYYVNSRVNPYTGYAEYDLLDYLESEANYNEIVAKYTIGPFQNNDEIKIRYYVYKMATGDNTLMDVTKTITIVAQSAENPSSSGFWGDAQKWFSKGRVNTNLGEATEAVNDLMDIINITGTTIIMIITTILGIKYIYSSAEGKAEVKKSLTVLLIACVFFFGWQGISNIIMPGNKLVFTSNTNSFKDIANKVFSYFTYISQFVMVAGVIYVGVKYMFSGAEGKADLKSKSMQFIIGIIMSFATVSFLTYISKVINSIV